MEKEMMSIKDKRSLEIKTHSDITRLMDGTEDANTLTEYSEIVFNNLFDAIDAMKEEDRDAVLWAYAYILRRYNYTVIGF